MDRNSGKTIDSKAHLAQSIGDILSTPLGSRIMRRDYGSMLPELIDHPQNATTKQLMLAATAKALGRWEPRIRINRAQVEFSANGRTQITIDATRIDKPSLRSGVASSGNERFRLTIPIRPRSATGAQDSAPVFA